VEIPEYGTMAREGGNQRLDRGHANGALDILNRRNIVCFATCPYNLEEYSLTR